MKNVLQRGVKRGVMMATAMLSLSLLAEVYQPEISATTRPSEIVPVWSEVKAGQWTFNYEGTLAEAKKERKYTLMYFTGLWWCPHCQSLEKNVLTQQVFKDYVAKKGFFLTALDFPARKGYNRWCWLWDAQYRKDQGLDTWTEEQITEELIKRFKYQGAMRTPGSSYTENTNVLLQVSGNTTNFVTYAANPVTGYYRVGYPTIVVIDPDGREAGRFEFDRGGEYAKSVEASLEYVINQIEVLTADTASMLFADPAATAVEGAAAQVYEGWLKDFNGNVSGSVVVKTGKKNAKTGLINVTGIFQPVGGKKLTVKGTAKGVAGETVTLEKESVGAKAVLTLGADGVTGTYTSGTKVYTADGARNVFKAKDPASKARAASVAKGCWTVALKVADNGGSAFANGTAGFSVTVANGGKAKIVGVLGNGTRTTVNTQVVTGENGRYCIPVLAKKGEYSFLMTFNNGTLVSVSDVSVWKSSSRTAKFTAAWDPAAVFSGAQGGGTVPAVMYLQLGNFPAALNGNPVVAKPSDDAVQVNGRKWTGSKGVTDLNVTYTAKTASFKGSFNAYVSQAGRAKKVKVLVSGVVINGVPYGTAVIKKTGTWAMSLTGACGGGC